LIPLAVVLCGAAALAWTALGGWELPAIGPRQPDYYNLLVAGFRKGSLALDVEVPKALLEAKDPIDVFKQAHAEAPHDVSYYKGHFYTYYGVVPAIVLFWPFRVLTGRELPLVLGSLALGIGAFVLTAWLWLRIVRDHFPRAGMATRVAGIAAAGLAGGQWVLERRISIWEPSIIIGNFFLVCMLAAAYLALTARRTFIWLALSGLALGLATGSRPTLVVAGLGFVPLLLAVAKAGSGAGKDKRGTLLKGALAAGLPLAAVGLALLAYNYARFGNPLELGLNYQLSTWNEVKRRHFRLSNIPYNAFLYFLAQPQWGRYFPFVHPIVPPARPGFYYGYEFVYGGLVIYPVLWFGAFVLPFVRRAAPVLRAFAATVASMALATAFVVLCFDTSAARYETDFLPWCVFLAALGWALLEDWLRERGKRAWARSLAAGFSVLAVFSCVMAFCCSAEIHEVFETRDPDTYRRVARIFNMPAALWEHATGFKGGAVDLNVIFAKKPLQATEPLVVTGVEYQKDYAYVYYQRDDVVRFCFQHPGGTVAESEDVTIKPGRAYTVRVEFGSLYPPEGDVDFDGWRDVEVASLKAWVRISVDGRTVLVAPRHAHEASPGTLQIGADTGDGFAGHRFSGVITSSDRRGWTRPVGAMSPIGDYDITFALPGGATLVRDPLVAVGRNGHADIVGLNMKDPGHYCFAYEGYGLGIVESGIFDAPADRTLSLRVRVGSTLGIDGASPLSALARAVVVWASGNPVWWCRTFEDLGANPPIHLFSNSVGSSEFKPEFQGRLNAAAKTPFVPTWSKGPFRALEMEIGGRGQGSEPLVSTGPSGAADVLVIEWLGGGRARLLYDHSGTGIHASAPFAWPEGTLNTLRIEMPSLAALDSRPAKGGTGGLSVLRDGRTVWAADVPFYSAGSGSVAIGRNITGCSVASPELQSVVVDLHQVPLN